MRRVSAFLVAFCMFVISVVGIHFICKKQINIDNSKFEYWISDDKFKCGESIAENLTEDNILVFGSSEFGHGTKTKYYPKNMFEDDDFDMVVVGAGYYQSLSHAITLGSIAKDIPNKKVVLILSPQWFRETGVLPEAYASRFSEDNFISMLQNDSLSDSTKEYVINRTNTLLTGDQTTLNRVKTYERVLFYDNASVEDQIYYGLYSNFIKEKSLFTVAKASLMCREKRSHHIPNGLGKIHNWEKYQEEAASEGKEATNNNDFHVLNSYYTNHLEPELGARKDSGLNSSYCTSPEYDDLRCFLDMCDELGVEPLLVSIPVNGWWYDYTGFSKSDREQYYQNIRDIAAEYDVELADFSGDEYTEYFLEDTIHIGWKGWVSVNESIYNFAKDKEQ